MHHPARLSTTLMGPRSGSSRARLATSFAQRIQSSYSPGVDDVRSTVVCMAHQRLPDGRVLRWWDSHRANRTGHAGPTHAAGAWAAGTPIPDAHASGYGLSAHVAVEHPGVVAHRALF